MANPQTVTAAHITSYRLRELYTVLLFAQGAHSSTKQMHSRDEVLALLQSHPSITSLSVATATPRGAALADYLEQHGYTLLRIS